MALILSSWLILRTRNIMARNPRHDLFIEIWSTVNTRLYITRRCKSQNLKICTLDRLELAEVASYKTNCVEVSVWCNYGVYGLPCFLFQVLFQVRYFYIELNRQM